MTSVSTRTNETAGAGATDDEDRAAATENAGHAVGRGADDGRGPAAPDGRARDASDASSADGVTVRTRLIESTVVAAITGVFVVLSGSARVAPDLSLPVALAGVLWLFVRTLPPVRRRGDGGSSAPEVDRHAGDETASTTGAGSTWNADPSPDETPVSTDRRLKLEVADHGGRMMQKELVESVDLSESAVSRRLSRLESEDDEVGRVCLGRENMVYLEGNRPEGADSPFAEAVEDEGENGDENER